MSTTIAEADAPNRSSRIDTWVVRAIGLVLPTLVGAGLLAGIICDLVTSGGLWAPTEITLSEAAATRDTGEIVRLIWRGDDPNVRWRVRRGLLSAVDEEVLPLEAAIRSRELEVVELLVDYGARVDDALRQQLACLAVQVNVEEIREFIDRLGEPLVGLERCHAKADTRKVCPTVSCRA